MSHQFLSSLASTHVQYGAIVLLVVLLLKHRRTSKQPFPYLPGPRPYPLIGNILDMPLSRFSIVWSKLGQRYGPLTWLTIPGQKILIVNSLEAAKELLDKRASDSVERPHFTMVTELLGMSNFLSVSGYNENWKKQRSHLKHAISAAVVRREYASLFETKAQQYLARCVDHPEGVLRETSRTIGEGVIKLTYGKLEDGRGRDYIKMSTRIAELMAFAGLGYVVDMFPSLQYLPSWLPGMKFKRDAALWKAEIDGIEGALFKLAKENSLSHDPEVQASFMFKKMQELHNKHEEGTDVQQQREDEEVLARSGMAIYVGGVETTETTMQSFIYAMIQFPTIPKKAQAEIDRVVGSKRFPTFKDQPDLPYLHAVMLETLRWSPAISFGVPHATRQDDTYEGYFIPKGTAIITNSWGFSRNPNYYTEPSNFDPERYLKQPPEQDPREYVFGHGQRICPGKDLAIQNFWILAALVLWAFNVVGEEDNPSSLKDADHFTLELISRPIPFKCRFVPRREDLKDKLGFVAA